MKKILNGCQLLLQKKEKCSKQNEMEEEQKLSCCVNLKLSSYKWMLANLSSQPYLFQKLYFDNPFKKN